MAFVPELDYSLFKNRREQVLQTLKQKNPDLKDGVIFLFADFEDSRNVFRQESTFYYLTGITEPGAVFVIYFDGRQVLYLPNYGGIREKWTKSCLSISENTDSIKRKLGVSEVKHLGSPCGAYSFSPFFKEDKYKNFLSDIDSIFSLENKDINSFACFTPLDSKFNVRYLSQRQTFHYLTNSNSSLSLLTQKKLKLTRDLSPVVHLLRKSKSDYEISLISEAVKITCSAHKSVAKEISAGLIEHEVQANIESVFTRSGAARPAFPSIVASGKNSTILHYAERNQKLKSGDLLVVDIGSEYGYYASDLTRTYPVSGKFSKRQLEIYNIVLQAQEYAESIVKPGMFLSNKKTPENSLTHLVLNFFSAKGLGRYFTHGIGHLLGLDVHDVDDRVYPLSEGDVFTIEPGLYIPEENIGIRIEDNYVLKRSGLDCISSCLPKKPEDIEIMMAK